MRHIRKSIEELRRYIAASESRGDLEKVDILLSIALEDIRRKLATKRKESGEN